MYGWDYANALVQAEAEGLPTVEAMVAFQEVVLAITLNPWGIAGDPPNNMPTIGFGTAGQISYLIMNDRRMVYVTQVQWVG